VQVLREGPLEATLRVTLDWELPAELTEDERARHHARVPYRITSEVTLRRGEPWVEVVTTLDNLARDHYLRVSFPTGVETDSVHVQSQFDVVTRPFGTPDPTRFDDPPQTEGPMNSFVDVSDGGAGLAILNEGLKAYEAHDDANRTVSVTLLRAFALRLYVPDKKDVERLARGSQCPGRHTFRYGLMPHDGDWVGGGVWAAAERFNTPMLAAQVGPTRHGTQPRTRSFLEVAPDDLHVSAVKQSEDGRGWVVRLFNPGNTAVRGRVRLNGGCAPPAAVDSPVERGRAEYALPAGRGRRWRQVQQVTLEELPEKTLKLNRDGWVGCSIGKKRIVTLKFLR